MYQAVLLRFSAKSILLPHMGFVDIRFSQFSKFNLGPSRVTWSKSYLVLVTKVIYLVDRALGICAPLVKRAPRHLESENRWLLSTKTCKDSGTGLGSQIHVPNTMYYFLPNKEGNCLGIPIPGIQSPFWVHPPRPVGSPPPPCDNPATVFEPGSAAAATKSKPLWKLGLFGKPRAVVALPAAVSR